MPDHPDPVQSEPVQSNPDTSPSLTLKRRLKATPAAVYAAWTQPAQLARWWGPHGCHSVQAELDLRVGGSFRITMLAPDGEEHDVRGTYQAVEPDRKLAFSWHWRTTPERVSQVTLTFKPDGDATILTLLHEQFFDAAARDRHAGGWSGALDKLEALFR